MSKIYLVHTSMEGYSPINTHPFQYGFEALADLFETFSDALDHEATSDQDEIASIELTYARYDAKTGHAEGEMRYIYDSDTRLDTVIEIVSFDRSELGIPEDMSWDEIQRMYE